MSRRPRTADTGAVLGDFATHFIVHCPRCESKALVGRNGRLSCTACFFNTDPGHWYGAATAYVAVKCRNCHSQIRQKADWTGQWHRLPVTCGHCGDTCAYDTTITRLPFHRGLRTDPVFGLPLWLQDDFRGALFWAFNYEHLDVLEAYIGAALRERGIEPRNTIRKNSSMTSRLPGFLKKAANRDGLLRLIGRLRQKV